MATNKTLIQKADMVLADLAGGGALNAEQSTAFTKMILAQPTMLRRMRKVSMARPQKEINKIGLSQPLLQIPPASGGLPAAQRVKPDFGVVQLNSKKVIAEMRIPYDVIEDTIEQGSIDIETGEAKDIRETIMELIAEKTAIELENIAINGDTAGATGTPLDLIDGFLKKATTNVYDQGGAPIDVAAFFGIKKLMPVEYRRVLKQMNNWVEPNVLIDYQQSLLSRQTIVGDASILNEDPAVFGAGIRVRDSAFMPAANGLLVPDSNMIFGIQRDFTLEHERMISEQMFKIVVSMRIDFQLEEENATVKVINIG